VEHKRLLSLCYRICDGLIRNALRAERRRRSLDNRMLERTTTDSLVVPDVAERVAGDARAVALLQRLSQADRQILLLLADGYKVAEIAVILGCGQRAATMRLRRAKDHLRTLIDRGGEEDPVGAKTKHPPAR
jgi:RNA polymerase sigma-70 factor (ECF subfamily)